MSGRWPSPADPGLQPERTSLAWTRTTCSGIVVGLLGLRWAGTLGWGLLGVVVLCLALVLSVLSRSQRRMERLGNALRVNEPARMGAASVLAMTATVVLAGAAAAAVVILA